MAASSLRWRSTMLRVKDPAAAVAFYQENFGLKLQRKEEAEGGQCVSYHLAAHDDAPVGIELMCDAGDKHTAYSSGNEEPYRGFGHIAFNCDDVYDASERLEKAGVNFQKKPNEGRMKGLAFVLDPQGYWVELVERVPGKIKDYYNLSQTMLRVKDPAKSLDFYTKSLGMTLVRELHFSDFSLYFLADLTPAEAANMPDPKSEEAGEIMKSQFAPVIELTHNNGTEDDESFCYHNAVAEPKGFGYLAFEASDLATSCNALGGEMIGSDKAMCSDPDGYPIKLFSIS